MRLAGNAFNRAELAGAFGDVGTLVPFVVGYVTINHLEPQGVLLGFGLVAVASGFYFRTPMSVQPMKAIGTTAITHPEAISPGILWAAGLVTGALAIPAAMLTFGLLGQSRVPAMLALLVYGAAAAILVDAALLRDLAAVKPAFRTPTLGLPALGWSDLIAGTLVLALPQAALTLGNAIIATAEEHNALFPHRPVSVRLLALDHGLMNLVAVVLGGVPMCRGAGGMAGHVRFGAAQAGPSSSLVCYS